MSLIRIDKNEIAVGVPLPWAIFDPQHNRMALAGEVIATQDHLDLLIASNACREIAENLEADDSKQELTAEEIAAGSKSDNKQQTGFSFEDMKLKVGDRLQIQPPPRISQDRVMVKLIGYVNNVSLLVTPPMDDKGLRLMLMENENLVVRVFSSQNAFGFSATIQKIIKIPFEYLHLAFPSEVQGMVIRKAPRVKTKIIATVSLSQTPEVNLPGMIINLSASGAMLDSRKILAKKGEAIRAAFRIQLHGTDSILSVDAIVRAIITDDPQGSNSADSKLIHHGIEFVNLQPNDKMILQSMIYQQMIENPHMLM